MASYLDRQDERRLSERAENLRLCGSYLDFRHYFTVDQVRLHAAKFCQQDRLCPLCAIRRGSKLLKRYSARVLHIQRHAKLLPRMTTFTVKNGDDLGERFRHLSGAYSKLMQRRNECNNRGGGWTEASRAWGAVASMEVKRGSGSGCWHPHLHAVWLCESEPDQDALSAEWKEITGDSHQIDVRPFEFERAGLEPTMDLLAADFAEVFKYALKFSTMDLADNLEAFQRLYGKRMIKSHGILYGIEEPSDLTDDPLEVDDLPFVTLLFRYVAGSYC